MRTLLFALTLMGASHAQFVMPSVQVAGDCNTTVVCPFRVTDFTPRYTFTRSPLGGEAGAIPVFRVNLLNTPVTPAQRFLPCIVSTNAQRPVVLGPLGVAGNELIWLFPDVVLTASYDTLMPGRGEWLVFLNTDLQGAGWPRVPGGVSVYLQVVAPSDVAHGAVTSDLLRLDW